MKKTIWKELKLSIEDKKELERLKNIFDGNSKSQIIQLISQDSLFVFFDILKADLKKAEDVFLLLKTGNKKNYKNCVDLVEETQKRSKGRVIWNFQMDEKLKDVTRILALVR